VHDSSSATPPVDPAASSEQTAFDDHETEGREGGDFRSPAHHLDRVDLEGQAARPVRSGFGAPRLSDAELREKVAVCNAVLGAVFRTLSAQPPPGIDAQDWLQQRLIGAVPRREALVAGLRIGPEGRLDVDAIATNVRQRPPAAHRTLVHDGLIALMDRVVQQCAECLPDAALEPLLVEVSGYRLRMGL
jgi:hypothetical protein